MYVKLFSKILDSSIWLEPSSTRVVWLTLLAAKDQDGFAQFAGVKNLARRANVSIEEAQAAVDCLTSPDLESSNPDNEGRRIEKVPGGYMVLNSEAYRNIKDHYSEKELTRQRVARHRAKKKKYVTETLQDVTDAVTSVSVSASVSGFVLDNSTKKEKRSRARASAKETKFSESPLAKFDDFRAALKDWPEEKVKFYFEKFVENGELKPQSGYKYANWATAARKWANKDPDEWKGNSSTQHSSHGQMTFEERKLAVTLRSIKAFNEKGEK